MEDFPDVSTYCQCLKMLSDQLRNVGSCQQSSFVPSADIWSPRSLLQCCHFDSPEQPSSSILSGLFHAHFGRSWLAKMAGTLSYLIFRPIFDSFLLVF